jgi:transcription elongation factor GreA
MANSDEKKEYLTKEKYNELTAELTDLKKNRRKEIAENLEYAKSLGDLSENAEYQEAREMQASIEERIIKLETVLKSAIIVSNHRTDTVGVGSLVTVKKGGETKKYKIVGSEEADTALGKISNRSPLGEALMGKKKGETFSFSTPGGKVSCEIVSIE